MKRKATYPKKVAATKPMVLKETSVPTEPMLRTQIYLSREEHDFLQREASRLDKPMAAVIRDYVDEKMQIPEDAWINNPILEPTPRDSGWKSPEDMSINLDHYLYGCPKDFIKVKGKWVEAPPLPDDYYEDRASREAYDRKIRQLDESK